MPADARGKSFGIYYLASGVFVLGGTAIFGELYEHVSHEAAFFTGAALAIAAAIAVVLGSSRTSSSVAQNR